MGDNQAKEAAKRMQDADELTIKILAAEAWQAIPAYKAKHDRSAELAKLRAERDKLVNLLK